MNEIHLYSPVIKFSTSFNFERGTQATGVSAVPETWPPLEIMATFLPYHSSYGYLKISLAFIITSQLQYLGDLETARARI